MIIGGVIYYFVPRIIEKKFYQYMDELNSQIILNIGNGLSQMEQTSLMLNFDEDLKMVLNVDKNSCDINRDSFATSYKYIDNYFFNFIYSFQAIHGAYIYSINGDNIYTRNENQAFHSGKRVNKSGISFKAKELEKPYRGVIKCTPSISDIMGF